MPGQRPCPDRGTTSFRSAGAAVCLLVSVVVGSAQALDAGDGTVISRQPTRQPLIYDTGKLARVEGAFGQGFADKEELSAYQEYAMHFGSLRKASGSVVLGTEDAIVEDLDQLVFGGTAYSAVFRLEGDPSTAVSVDVSATPGAGFQLSTFNTSLGAPPLEQVLDEFGSLIFHLGATLTLDAAEIEFGEDQEIAFTITASYE